ncbi:chorismate mutase [Patescibacteria group bacterium]|nr:chorismate mutase [Patescibacteria group bacterium]
MLGIYRKEIDRIDGEILKLLVERMRVVEKIGEYKRKARKDIVDLERLSEMLQFRKVLAGELGLEEELVERLFEMIHDFSVRRQER